MEDVGTVAVHLNSLYLLGVDIAANVTAPLQHQNGLSVFLHLLGKCRAIKPRTHHKIIIMHDFLAFPLYSQTVCHNLCSSASIIAERIQIVNHSTEAFHSECFMRTANLATRSSRNSSIYCMVYAKIFWVS